MTVPSYLAAGPAAASVQAESGAPPPLLFLHGIGGNATNFAAELERFGANGDRCCVAWTMPGYDTSPPLTEMTFPALADAVVALLDELAIPAAVLVGHSMGGMVAQETALRHPGRVASLVLVATSPSLGPPGGDFREQFLTSRLGPLDAGRTPGELAPDVIGALVAAGAPDSVIAEGLSSMGKISADGYRAALHCIVTFDRRNDLGSISCPTLLIAGSEDRLAPPSVMTRMHDAIPDSRLEVIAGSGHLVNLEAPAAFASVLEGFLA